MEQDDGEERPVLRGQNDMRRLYNTWVFCLKQEDHHLPGVDDLFQITDSGRPARTVTMKPEEKEDAMRRPLKRCDASVLPLFKAKRPRVEEVQAEEEASLFADNVFIDGVEDEDIDAHIRAQEEEEQQEQQAEAQAQPSAQVAADAMSAYQFVANVQAAAAAAAAAGGYIPNAIPVQMFPQAAFRTQPMMPLQPFDRHLQPMPMMQMVDPNAPMSFMGPTLPMHTQQSPLQCQFAVRPMSEFVLPPPRRELGLDGKWRTIWTVNKPLPNPPRKPHMMAATPASAVHAPPPPRPSALPPPQVPNAKPEVGVCCCCKERPSLVVFKPCKHLCVCTKCADKFHRKRGGLTKCPICNQPYTRKEQVTIS